MSPRPLDVVILVRVDDMADFTTLGSLSIRFPLDTDNVGDGVEAAVAAALKQAPPLKDWMRT